MHRYNNQDHSMLTTMTAVENIMNGIKTKDNIWDINMGMEYHEKKQLKDYWSIYMIFVCLSKLLKGVKEKGVCHCFFNFIYYVLNIFKSINIY